LVCEQHNKPGGYVTSFERRRFIFDGGCQSFSSNGIVFPILREFGLWDKVKFVKSGYEIIAPDIKVKLDSLEEVAEEFKSAFPDSRSGIESYFNEIQSLIHPLKKMFSKKVPLLLKGFRKALATFPMHFTNPRFFINMRKYKDVTNLDLINKYIKNSKAKFILSSLGYPVMSAITTAGMWYSWVEDYWYPIGGMQKFSNLFTDFIRKKNGEVSLQTKVAEVMVENGKAVGVKTGDGRKFYSRYIVSNVDYKQTFTKLVEHQHLSPEFIKRICQARVSESMFCVYLGVNVNVNSLKDFAHHIFYFPSYGKTFLEKNPEDADFFKNCGMEISIPSLADDSLAPSGKSVITLTTFAPYNWQNRWQTQLGERVREYKRLKEKVARQLIDTARGVINELYDEQILVKETASPLTYERYTLNNKGASAGWIWNPEYSLSKQYANSLKTPIRNLFTVGHWSMSPGGVPSAMLTGKMVANTIGL